ncbi:MAG: tripartite tricarboxylate transporter substrate binding protein [Betaproteobacteria bacterium]|nr:tripartite tricarboxylate transporter substrate binding protein [Betaproteobacteria bacterium]
MRKLLLSIVLLSAAQTALAQAWPARPIRLICPYPGGPVELSSRIVAQKLQEALGQPVVVENRPGAGGVIGADYVAKAAPDGYTLLMGAIATHAINPSLMPSLPYDAMRDFRHIALVVQVPNVLVVNNDLPVKSVKDLIALARTKPGQLDFGSGSTGSTGHLAGELFKQMTGTFMVHIPYRSSAPAVADMLAGRVHLMFDNLASALPNIKAGKVRALAVTTTRRTDFLPDLPTLDESGLKGFNLTTWWGLMAPAKTPNEIVNRLSAETLKAMDAPDARERLRNLGSATPGVRTPEAFSAFIEAEKTLYARLVKVSGAKPD